MILRALFLTGAWFTLSLVVLLLAGARLRRLRTAISLEWLAVVLGLGDAFALFTFGRPLEVMLLTASCGCLGIGVHLALA